jgi:hypothetical protein
MVELHGRPCTVDSYSCVIVSVPCGARRIAVSGFLSRVSSDTCFWRSILVLFSCVYVDQVLVILQPQWRGPMHLCFSCVLYYMPLFQLGFL